MKGLNYFILYSHTLSHIYDSSKLELPQSNKVSSTVLPDLLTLFPVLLGHKVLAVTNQRYLRALTYLWGQKRHLSLK